MNKLMRVVGCLFVLLALLANIGFAAETKTIVFLYTDMVASIKEDMLKGLEQAGLVDQQNVEILQIRVSSDTDPLQIVAQVQEAAPDVILNAAEYRPILEALHGLSIPVIARMHLESYVEAGGMPTANITGVYTTIQDMVYHSYKFLQKVAPLKPGQQVVYFDNTEFSAIPKEVIIDALERLQIPLKAVVDVTVFEDWQQAVLQYNNDPEVGWVLRTAPTKKQDGSSVNIPAEFFPWEREHFKKPTIAYWEFAVRAGTLCGFATDTREVGIQCGEMVARILQGEDVRTIKAQYPNKVSISLNRKTAMNLGIVFSMDVLDLANVIYDDYEGKQVIRK
jgi:putative ABC transport system substrate-binding protein